MQNLCRYGLRFCAARAIVYAITSEIKTTKRLTQDFLPE